MTTHEKIVWIAALSCDTTPAKIKSRDRHDLVAYARFLAMAMEAEITNEKLYKIARRYNRRSAWMVTYATIAIKRRVRIWNHWRVMVNKARSELNLPAL